MQANKTITGDWEEDCTGPVTEYKSKTPINTIGDLITFLQGLKSPNWCIAIPDQKGVPREEIVIISTGISTVLTSKGKEIEW